MSRDVRIYLEDILESASRVLEYAEHMEFDDFLANKMAYDAILRNLELIGEAAKNVPNEIRGHYSQVEWRKIAGLRDVLVHQYFGLEDETLWNIVKTEVPELLEQVKRILASESKNQDDTPQQ